MCEAAVSAVIVLKITGWTTGCSLPLHKSHLFYEMDQQISARLRGLEDMIEI